MAGAKRRAASSGSIEAMRASRRAASGLLASAAPILVCTSAARVLGAAPASSCNSAAANACSATRRSAVLCRGLCPRVSPVKALGPGCIMARASRPRRKCCCSVSEPSPATARRASQCCRSCARRTAARGLNTARGRSISTESMRYSNGRSSRSACAAPRKNQLSAMPRTASSPSGIPWLPPANR